MMRVPPQVMGSALFNRASDGNAQREQEEQPKPNKFMMVLKGVSAPLLAGVVESFVANHAEVQRYLGPQQLARLSPHTPNMSVTQRMRFNAGPAFTPNAGRNFVMSIVSFVTTPTLFQHFSDEHKTPQSLFLFGLGMNIFVGNAVAITLQSTWGRSLDHVNTNGLNSLNYRTLISNSLRRDGIRAFFSPAKWFTRVLMNAPAQGTIPWFANFILPKAEPQVLGFARFVHHRLYHHQ